MDNQTFQPHQSSLGQDANLIALLIYLGVIVLGFIPGVQYVAWALPLVIFLIEKNSSFVKYHALQCLILMIISTLVLVICFILAFILIGIILLIIYAVAASVFMIIAMVKAWNYEAYQIPLIGAIAAKYTLEA